MVWLLELERLTVKTKGVVPLLPSAWLTSLIARVGALTFTLGCGPLMEKGELEQLVLPKALVVHVLVPVVVAVAVKLMATVPPGSMLFALPPERVVVITPPEVVGVFQVRVVGPGSVATTLSEPGVPAPAGIVMRTQSITSMAVLVLVTVSVYVVAVFTVADVGLIVAVNCAVSLKVVCAVHRDDCPVAVARNRTPTSERSGLV